MGRKTGIQWTSATWNPIRGCSRVSPGCINCYAEHDAMRVNRQMAAKGLSEPYGGLVKLSEKGDPRWTGEVRLVPNHLDDPLRATKPQLIFVNSMSDLFHENLSNETIAGIFGIMAASTGHIFQVLTKRAERMLAWFEWAERFSSVNNPGEAPQCVVSTMVEYGRKLLLANGRKLPKAMQGSFLGPKKWPLETVWLGVSTEDQERADERIPYLLQCPAAVRWVSYEPAIGPVHLRPEWIIGVFDHCPTDRPMDQCEGCPGYGEDCGAVRGPHLDWIVVGGESAQPGRTARMFDIAWARNIIREATGTPVKVFVKQLGKRPWYNGIGKPPADHVYLEQDVIGPDGSIGWQYDLLRSRKGGDPEEWPSDLRVREMPGGIDVRGFA